MKKKYIRCKASYTWIIRVNNEVFYDTQDKELAYQVLAHLLETKRFQDVSMTKKTSVRYTLIEND